MLKMDEENSKKLRKDVTILIQNAVQIFASDLISKSIQDVRQKGKRRLATSNLISAIKTDFSYDFLLDAQIFEDSAIEEARPAAGRLDKRSVSGSKKKGGRQLGSKDIGKMIEEGKFSGSNSKRSRRKELEGGSGVMEVEDVVVGAGVGAGDGVEDLVFSDGKGKPGLLDDDGKKKKVGVTMFDFFKKA